ncbi:MAG: DUF6261 family protein [Bacteroidales bacterium]
MKCKRIHLENLSNNNCLQFFREVKQLTEKYGAAALAIEAQFEEFLVYYKEFNECNNLVRKSALTEDLRLARIQNNLLYRGLVNNIKAHLTHFDQEHRKAAKRLQIVVKHFGNITRQNYHSQIASLHGLLSDLEGVHAAETNLLQLGDWISQLSKSKEAFSELINLRNSEIAGRTKLRTHSVRAAMSDMYRSLLHRLDALALLHDSTKYKDYLKSLNIITTRYVHNIALRKGHAASKRSAENAFLHLPLSSPKALSISPQEPEPEDAPTLDSKAEFVPISPIL